MTAALVRWLAPHGVFAEPHTYGPELKAAWWRFVALLVILLLIPATRRALRRFGKKHAFLATVGGQAVAVVTLLLVAEFAAGKILARRPPPPKETTEGTYQNAGKVDPLLGYKLNPNLKTTLRKIIDGKTIFDVRYSSDEFGRRVTENPEGPKRGFAAYFGCSYTFGEGVNDEETLPSAAARLAPDVQHYNYGLSGYGPQETLAWMESGQLPAQLKEKTGTAYHVFMDGHVERAIGSQYIYNQWGPNMPYYNFDAKHELVRLGTFSTGRPWISLAYLLLGRSDLARLLKVNFPKVAERHFELTAAMLEQSRTKFESQFPGSHFAVLIYPGAKFGNRLKKYLLEKKVTVLDYSRLLPDYDEKWTIPGDGHPTPLAHEAVAKKLARVGPAKGAIQKPFQKPGPIDPP